MDLKSLLSESQYEAATCTSRPVCILAGAGSGKTRTITHRMAFLVEQLYARPWTILAVTFTNKAAKEMRDRVEALVPGQGKKMNVGTFHGTAARLLRRHGDAIGLHKSFVIYDQDDAQRLLKRVVVDEHNFNKDLVKPIASMIDSWQSEGLLPQSVPETPWNPVEEKGRQAYARYFALLKEMNAVDFGSLLLHLRSLLEHPIGREIRRNVHHLLVDEYQDTNRVQADIIFSLAKTAKTVAVVGDDDQAIYGWRGASADNLKSFVKQMDNAQLIRLEDNYRSTATILEAANGVISQNTDRLGKLLRPTLDEGRKVRVLKAKNDIEEARKVVREIQGHTQAGHTLEEVAILYRTNSSSRAFEDELRRNHLPYRLVGGVRFYDRKEVKDALATVRCALNPRSDVDTLRFLQAMPRGIGPASVKKLQTVATRYSCGLIEVMADEKRLDEAGVPKKARTKALDLGKQVMGLGARITLQAMPEGEDRADYDAKKALACAVEICGISDRLEAEDSIESQGRLENLSALVSAAAQFVEDAEEEEVSDDVAGFLEQAALLSGGDEKEDENTEKLTLMTLHAAKGLEFDLVFLIGMEEHGFPHARALKDDAEYTELEEERRLAYVGITRAKQRLVCTWAQRRMVFGTIKMRRPSRFLDEMPMEVLEGDTSHGRIAAGTPKRERAFARPALTRIEGDVDGEHIEYDAEPVEPRRQKAKPKRHSLRDVNADDPRMAAVRKALERVRRPRIAEVPANSEDIYDVDEGKMPVGYDADEQKMQRSELEEPLRISKNAGVKGAEVVTLPSNEGFEKGTRVSHSAFGEGAVVELRGRGRLGSALVRFDEGKTRVVIVRYLQAL
ncbi:MAG: UvrD-helicase domain-containing protein [Deltaproteobacteria bacterium]|nr:UvrD-helicase domain-containing protein [Deltaproteobacteria bacterium]